MDDKTNAVDLKQKILDTYNNISGDEFKIVREALLEEVNYVLKKRIHFENASLIASFSITCL